MLLGVITALLAAVPGFVDYTDIRSDHPAKRIATIHLMLNLIVVALYGINLGVRYPPLVDQRITGTPLIFSLGGIVLLFVSSYLGGSLVYGQGIAVGRHNRRTPTPEDTLHLSTENAAEEGDVIFVPVPSAEQLSNEETLRAQIDGQVMTIAKVDNFARTASARSPKGPSMGSTCNAHGTSRVSTSAPEKLRADRPRSI